MYFEKEIRGKSDRRFQNSSETSIGDLPARIDVQSRDLYIAVVTRLSVGIRSGFGRYRSGFVKKKFLSWLSKDTEHIHRARMKLNDHMIFIATILLHAHRHWPIAAASCSLY